MLYLGPVQTTLEKLKSTSVTDHFGVILRKARLEKTHDFRNVFLFEKLCFQNVSSQNKNAKPANVCKFSSVWSCLRKPMFSWQINVEVSLNRRSKAANFSCVPSFCRKYYRVLKFDLFSYSPKRVNLHKTALTRRDCSVLISSHLNPCCVHPSIWFYIGKETTNGLRKLL